MNNTQKDTIYFEKLRYNNNSLAYKLGLGGIIFSLIACFIGLNSLKPANLLTVFIVLLNIAILLFGFLSAEKVKTYTKKYTYYMYALGGACILRMFIYPLMLIVNYQKFINMVYAEGDIKENYANAVTKYGNVLGVTITGKLVDGKVVTTGYMFSNGTARGILLIVLLGLAAACFIGAGIINYTKEKQLSSYLKSIGAKR